MDREKILRIIESLLFVSIKPLSVEKITELINTDLTEENKLIKESVEELLSILDAKYSQAEYVWQLLKVAGGYQFVTKREFSKWVKKLYKAKFTIRLSIPALETVSIIAYKQPITKVEVDTIRGVDSSGVLNTLLTRKLIKISGRREGVRTPLEYSTTTEFLKYFGLNSLEELPLTEEIEQLLKENKEPVQAEIAKNIENEDSDETSIENELLDNEAEENDEKSLEHELQDAFDSIDEQDDSELNTQVSEEEVPKDNNIQ
ncbi:SMC-Scp complex subunit ScpB [bacterium]